MKIISSFLIFIILMPLSGASTDLKLKETILLSINERILSVLKSSTEANIFLGEDLLEASEFLSSAKIKWLKTYSEAPYIYEMQPNGIIGLNSDYSFKTTEENKVILLVEILFHLKRQIEGSLLPLPHLRIELFAKKFATVILSEKNFCSFALRPIEFSIESYLKNSFLDDLTRIIRKKNYYYDSKWANWVLWIEGESLTDSACAGFSRKTFKSSALLINWQTMEVYPLGESEASSCSGLGIAQKKSLNKLIHKVKKHIPTCKVPVGEISFKEIL